MATGQHQRTGFAKLLESIGVPYPDFTATALVGLPGMIQLVRQLPRLFQEGYRLLRNFRQASAPIREADDFAVMGRRLERLGYDQANTSRILQSVKNGDQVVIVGENMRRVNAASNMVNNAGGRAVTYSPRNWTDLSRNSLEANRSWIRYWGKDKGATILDIGRQPTIRRGGPSPFYGIENRSLNRWDIYTPFGN